MTATVTLPLSDELTFIPSRWIAPLQDFHAAEWKHTKNTGKGTMFYEIKYGTFLAFTHRNGLHADRLWRVLKGLPNIPVKFETSPKGITLTWKDDGMRGKVALKWTACTENDDIIPCHLQGPAPARPTKSELMTALNVERARIRRHYAPRIANAPTTQARAAHEHRQRLELRRLYRAFGNLQRRDWSEHLEADWKTTRPTSELWTAITDRRKLHDITPLIEPDTVTVCVAGEDVETFTRRPGTSSDVTHFFSSRGIPFYGKRTPVRSRQVNGVTAYIY